MNWKLILSLSTIGVLMGIAGRVGLTGGIEGILWIVIGIVCAIQIAKRVAGEHFLHGFMVGLIGGLVMPLLWNGILLAPFISLVSGIVFGLFSWVAGKIVRKGTAENARSPKE